MLIGPDKKLKLSLNYPASVARYLDEIARINDALQLCMPPRYATPPHHCTPASGPKLFYCPQSQGSSMHCGQAIKMFLSLRCCFKDS